MISERKTDPWRLQLQINQIERASVKGGLEKKLCNLAVWYYKNQPRIPDEDLGKRLAFVEKALETTMEVLAEAVVRLQHAERFPSSSLLLPPQ